MVELNNLVGLLEFLGLEDVVDTGEEVRAWCPGNYLRDKNGNPLHDEHHPRHWSINRSSLQHHCFSCHYKGGIHRLVMDLSGVNAWDASRLIRQYGVSLEALTTIEEPKFVTPKVLSEEHLRMFHLPPQRAMDSRKIDLEVIGFYGIRWNPTTSGWIFPIRSPSGELWGWQEKAPDRVMNFPTRLLVKKSQTLFGLHRVARFSPTDVILVESPLDCAYIRRVNPNIFSVASFGSHVSETQMRLLIDHCQHIMLALDNDDSGIKATEKILKARWHRRIPISILNYTESRAKDPGEMSPSQFRSAYDGAVGSFTWRP